MEERRHLASELALVLVAAVWGFAFVAQRAGMDHVGPFTYNGVRFLLGFIALLPLIAARRAAVRRQAFAAGENLPPAFDRRLLAAVPLAALALFAGATLQQVGMQWTSAGKAGFITGLYVVFVPVAAFFSGKRTGARIWLGAALAIPGLWLLSAGADFSIGKGDLIVLAGAFFWTAHILVVDRWASRVDPIELAAGQFLLVGLATLVLAFLLEEPGVAAIRAAAIPILYGGLGSIGVGYTLQMVAQKRAHPARASLIMSLEAPFAALGGGLILGERLAGRALAGAALMLAGMVLAQLPARKRPAGGLEGAPV
ncbi:MAG: DMT family transporter [Spirochaetales bacterium]|nr:DMT family transporter [Spirochaetales bacterium]